MSHKYHNIFITSDQFLQQLSASSGLLFILMLSHPMLLQIHCFGNIWAWPNISNTSCTHRARLKHIQYSNIQSKHTCNLWQQSCHISSTALHQYNHKLIQTDISEPINRHTCTHTQSSGSSRSQHNPKQPHCIYTYYTIAKHAVHCTMEKHTTIILASCMAWKHNDKLGIAWVARVLASMFRSLPPSTWKQHSQAVSFTSKHHDIYKTISLKQPAIHSHLATILLPFPLHSRRFHRRWWQRCKLIHCRRKRRHWESHVMALFKNCNTVPSSWVLTRKLCHKRQ